MLSKELQTRSQVLQHALANGKLDLNELRSFLAALGATPAVKKGGKVDRMQAQLLIMDSKKRKTI